jgi:hypothetical protein
MKENEVRGACGTHGEERKLYKVLVGKPEGKRPLERHRRRWEDGIKMDLRTIAWGGADSPGSGEGPVAGCCECGDEPSGSGATKLHSIKKNVCSSANTLLTGHYHCLVVISFTL